MAAPTLDEVWNRGLHAVQRRLQVDGHHLVDLVVRQIEDHLRHAASGVVDPHVDPAEGVDHAIAQRVDLPAPRDIGGDRDRARADLVGQPPQLRLAPGREYDTVTARAELTRERRADPAAGAGDDDGSHPRFPPACDRRDPSGRCRR